MEQIEKQVPEKSDPKGLSQIAKKSCEQLKEDLNLEVLDHFKATIEEAGANDFKILAQFFANKVFNEEFARALFPFKKAHWNRLLKDIDQRKQLLPKCVHVLDALVIQGQKALAQFRKKEVLLLRDEREACSPDGEVIGRIYDEFRIKKDGLERLTLFYREHPFRIIEDDLALCSVSDLLKWIKYDVKMLNDIVCRFIGVLLQWHEEVANEQPKVKYI